jgi:diguanylate cyclase (GGDEF)-like protein/PAS domain S-box-containing protein
MPTALTIHMTSSVLVAVLTVGVLVCAGLLVLWRFRVSQADAQAADDAGRTRTRSGSSPAGAEGSLARVLMESSEDGVFVCSGDGVVHSCNAAACKLIGAPSERILGQPITQWIPAAAAKKEGGAFPLSAGLVEAHRRADGPDLNLRLTVHEWSRGSQRLWLVVAKDLTEQRQYRKALEKLARYDGLTGLPNRTHFRDNLARAMERSRRSGKVMALFFLDLDRFKIINDSLGHEAGDKLLQHVAEVLISSLRGSDSLMLGPRTDSASLSRLGGDEFTVILEDVGGAEDAALVAQRLLDSLSLPLTMGGEEVQISASIGISLYPSEDVDLDGLIRNTDMAMYRSKSLGRSTYSFFSDDLNAAVSARLSLENSLRRAVERHEFFLHYQPKANLSTRQVTGVEALIRWRCPGRGLVPPDRFISVLEETGLIVQAGAWVIREACAQAARWDALGLPPMSMAVNLSARQLRHPHLVALVRDTLKETGIEPHRLELELTESLLLEDTEGNRSVLKAFRELGVRLAIDDFGTGHSSLAYLRRLNVDTLKIDRSFVAQLPDDQEDAAIATAVVALGKSLSMKVVAEGVETEAQASFLHKLGCNDMQGWLLSKALAPEALTQWLTSQHQDFLKRTRAAHFSGGSALELPTIALSMPAAREADQTISTGAS